MEQKTIETRQNFYWHFVDVYLDLLSHIAVVYEDKTFCKMVEEMHNYIGEKLELASDGDIIDTYVTVLQQSDE